MLMEVRGCLQGSSLFYQVDSRDGTQVVRLGCRSLHPPNRLTSPHDTFLVDSPMSSRRGLCDGPRSHVSRGGTLLHTFRTHSAVTCQSSEKPCSQEVHLLASQGPLCVPFVTPTDLLQKHYLDLSALGTNAQKQSKTNNSNKNQGGRRVCRIVCPLPSIRTVAATETVGILHRNKTRLCRAPPAVRGPFFPCGPTTEGFLFSSL